MQPQETKLTVAIAMGLIVLGVVIWVSATSRSSSPTVAHTAASSSIRGLSPEALSAPLKIVTMLSVPEVIYSSTEAAALDSLAPEAKPSKDAHDTEVGAVSSARVDVNAPAAVRKQSTHAARRSEDTFLVKPQ